MKNIVKNIFKILVVTAGCLMFASFSPSLDGRAVVVDNGVFPQGLFAKTVGYLPGDIISVTNIAGDATVDLLVIGALDPSEGVAIMLSPEAADAMGIDKGANNIVKITKRSGQDERVYGNAVISKSAADLEDYASDDFENIGDEENTEAFDDAEETEVPEEIAEPEEEEPFAEEEAVDEEEAFEEEAVNEEEAFEEEPAEEAVEEPEEAAVEEEFTDEEPEELEEAEEEAFDEEELDEIPEEAEEAVEEEAPVVEEEADIEEETEEPEDESFDEEALADENLNELPVEEESEPEVSDEESVNEEEPEELPAEEATEDNPSEEFIEADELDALPEDAETETEAEAEDEIAEDDETEEYEAIVLVPVDSNPPESESDEVEDVISDDELEAIEEPVEEAPVVAESPVPPVAKAASNTSYDKYVVPSLKDLESGKYYIQIAVYSADDNILEIINKYGNNYPVTIVPMAGSERKQVLVGPLTVDEYKVVLERFKSYGFKDSFLRKIR